MWGWMRFLIHDQRQMCQYYSRSGTCRSLTLSLLVLSISYQCCTSSYCRMLMLYSFRGRFHKPSLRPNNTGLLVIFLKADVFLINTENIWSIVRRTITYQFIYMTSRYQYCVLYQNKQLVFRTTLNYIYM